MARYRNQSFRRTPIEWADLVFDWFVFIGCVLVLVSIVGLVLLAIVHRT